MEIRLKELVLEIASELDVEIIELETDKDHYENETSIVLHAASSALGNDRVVRYTDIPTLGSEDFSFYLQKIPGCFFFVGNGDSAPLHNPYYDFNDS